MSKPKTSQEQAPKAVRIFDGEYYVMAINAISVQEDPLSGQLPSDKELASEGPEARQGARPEVDGAPSTQLNDKYFKKSELQEYAKISAPF